MLSLEMRMHINDAEVTATVIDGEAIMINLSTGVYYSTDAAGARIWQLAAAGANISEISDAIANEYSVARSQAMQDVEQLVDQFIEEGLLIPHLYNTLPVLAPAEPVQAPYHTPQLDVYREIGHLLALDPPMPGLENITWDEPSHA